MTRVLHRHGDAAFDDRNLLLHLALGLLSAGDRLERHLGTSSVPVAEPDDPAVLAVLGLLAFRERLRTHLRAVPEPSPPSSEGRDRPVTGILR